MLFMFPGETPVAELDETLKALAELLQREGLDCVTQLQISFLGWRGNARCQIVNESNQISEMTFDESADGNGARVLRPGATIRDRPDNLDFSPFAVMFGHDD